MKRMECLDGLRGVLAVYVMLGHMAPFTALPAWIERPLSHGGAAVDVFFILSGMVIVQSLESHGYATRPFLIARCARIFPVFLVMLAAGVAVQPLPVPFAAMPWIGPDSQAHGIWSDGWPKFWVAEIAAHLTMTHGLFPNAVLPDAWVSFLGAAWSLSTEWQFYVLALVLGRLGHRGARLVAIFLGIALAGLAWDFLTHEEWHFSRAFLPNKAHYFALGMASTSGLGRRFVPILLPVLALCALRGGVEKLVPPLVWTLCLAAQFGDWGILARVLRCRVAQFLGAVSYPIYLANEPIQKALGCMLAWVADGDAMLFSAMFAPLALLVPVGAAVLLHKYLERPALRWGKARARRMY